ncbi:hypothetical protein BJF90_06160 [Pseudonocardia sp. CNS-004]|nr:hypothetical protein BJF90_06160 [Pseudonocardia sp. CNS-004]
MRGVLRHELHGARTARHPRHELHGACTARHPRTAGSIPASRSSPASGRSRPSRQRSSVVLPPPLRPATPTTSPAPTSRSRPSSTGAQP